MSYQVILGVTGHRRLAHVDILRKTVKAVLNEIVIEFSKIQESDIALCVLSPLAEGADRLVAEEVLAYSEDSTLRVVLPLEFSEYMKDFATNKSKEEFNRLLRHSQTSFSLREKPIAEEYPVGLQGNARIQAYENVGKYVVDQSDVLIALWDGKEPKGKGGTAQVVQYAREKKSLIFIINTLDPNHYSKEGTIYC